MNPRAPLRPIQGAVFAAAWIAVIYQAIQASHAETVTQALIHVLAGIGGAVAGIVALAAIVFISGNPDEPPKTDQEDQDADI